MDHTECNNRIEYLNNQNLILKNKIFELESLNENLKSQVEYFQTKFLESNLMSEGKDISSCLTEIYNSLSLDNSSNNSNNISNSSSNNSNNSNNNNKIINLRNNSNRNYKINLTANTNSNNSSANTSPFICSNNSDTSNYESLPQLSDSENSSPVLTSQPLPSTPTTISTTPSSSNRPPPPPRPAFLRSTSDNFEDLNNSSSNNTPTKEFSSSQTSSPLNKGSTWSTAVIPLKMRSETIVQQKSPYSPDTTLTNLNNKLVNELNINNQNNQNNQNNNNNSNGSVESPSKLTPRGVSNVSSSPTQSQIDRRSKTSPFPANVTPPLSSSGHLVRTASASSANAIKPQQLSNSCSANITSANNSRPSTPVQNNSFSIEATGSPSTQSGLYNPFEITEDEPEVLDDPKLVIAKVTSDGASSTPSFIVKGGTIEKLVNRLIARHDPDFASAFLLTHKSFTTSGELLDLLIEFYLNNKPLGHAPSLSSSTTSISSMDLTSSTGSFSSQSDEVKRKRAIRLKITNVIKSWVDKHYYDFEEDKQLIAKLDNFINTHIMQDMDKIGINLKRLLSNDRIVPVPIFSNGPPAPIPPKIKNGSEVSFKDLDPTEVARQLTLFESDLFRKIGAKECLGQAWNKQDKEEKAPNIVNFIKRFNQVSSWVATEILRQEKLKDRVSYIKRFILLAQKCRELNNFNATMEILSGLQNSSVYRLRKTWERIEAKPILKNTYDELMSLMSSNANYKNYMQELHNIHPPCIPYLGVYLTHLTFIEDGMKNHLNQDEEIINFEKCRKISVVIREIKQYQQQQYHLETEEITQRYLNNLPSIQSQKSMYKLSLICEPKEKESSSFDSGYGSISDRPDKVKKEFSMTSLLNSWKNNN
ncbi:hypothetical protein DICPUDRAFT_53443 [Dictyostelium purpureum]|uniref:Ras guanine nucleotide exchange factor n=1 Tax=Dictyostelium purpureum TaxID=5786 RepID=F0ZCT2_DICPU|nr:uncharacterized protein DICPUDRAFT_53443 [Dictyostelium purpureum]EGC38273.1 hypothetical protein DICPUDRAFT_53443 [Dictyostelium purpureum]|eukprot:XP_003285230.1 hypothetical protein DICPUDRAFT_53443 [Dictyostelium purpureum]